MQKAALADPAFLVDEDALHHGDLARRPAERLKRDRAPRPGGLPERDEIAGLRHAFRGVFDGR
jgi:hypothetical protein